MRWTTLFFAFALTSAFAQPEKGADRFGQTLGKSQIAADTLDRFLRAGGTFEAHLRSFFMATVNRQDFPDYHALAVGGGLGYYSPVIRHFQAGMSGFFIYNLGASNLEASPPYANRYEASLFNANDPNSNQNLDRLEDLYLRYYWSEKTNSFIQAGRFHLKTPLINLQDGRMRPNLQEGVWTELNKLGKWSVKAGWIVRTSPRGSIRWYRIEESLGFYPMGRATNGMPANYGGQVKIPGIAVAQLGYRHSINWSVQWWDYHIPRLVNTQLLKTEWHKDWRGKRMEVGLQLLSQQSLADKALPAEAEYISPDERSEAASVRITTGKLDGSDAWSLNYSRITRSGRFLFPREWGVESFYTFMYRERTEGAGDVHAWTIQHLHTFGNEKNLSLEATAGLFLMPDVSNATLNKYTMPDFYHFNLRARYQFPHFLHGLQVDVLYTYKGSLDRSLEVTPAFFHNKVEMHHVSLALDYYF